jgi:methylase of polypeptide subunit release factors
MAEYPTIYWTESDTEHSARWHSESAVPPKRVAVADDQLPADTAFRLTSEGTGLLWRGDFQNAKQLLQALARRVDRKKPKPATSANEAFHAQRHQQAQRANVLGKLLIQFGENYHVNLRRAPDVTQACTEAYGPADKPFVASLRELLGIIGAHEWRKKGIDIPAVGGRIHPHYGVFAPVRSEYVKLVNDAPLPSTSLAFDIGAGTGVLAAVLARRGVQKIIATDQDQRALNCARENIARLGYAEKVEIVEADLFPPGRAPLIVCNPPWVPARPSSPLEHAVYDPDSRMLRGFLGGLAEHLEPDGEGWLLLSDLAEHLGLRSRAELDALIESAGLAITGRIDIRPNHPRAADDTDPLHNARAAEVTSLWRLVHSKKSSSGSVSSG